MLTDAQCRNAICPPDKKQARLSDAGGMYLQVSPAGSKRWFLKCRTAGVEKQLALGSYPDVSLTAARKARDAAKLQKSEGRDPVQARKIEKLKASTPAGDTFEATALEWYAMKLDGWSSHYAIREKRNLEKDLFPFLGVRHIGEIEPIELLATVRRVEERGALDVAHRVLTTAGQPGLAHVLRAAGGCVDRHVGRRRQVHPAGRYSSGCRLVQNPLKEVDHDPKN
jgi:hypothetical protein